MYTNSGTSSNIGGVRFGASSHYGRNEQKGHIRNFFQKYTKKQIWLGIGGFFAIVFILWFSVNVLQGMPDISNIKNMVFSESTVIEDRNGKVLYRLYEENREYVPFSGISQNMINAIVAMEDQRYWEHNGLDVMGIFRAGINNVLHLGKGMQGASTIPQQLLKNILLNKEQKKETANEKIVRKFREFILTSRLDGALEGQIFREKGDLNNEQLHKEMKNKILELYLNYIPFGNNAFGVEAASKNYFDKSAKDLDVLESTILASIPKSATIYNPYKNRARVMGSFIIQENGGKELTGDALQAVHTQVAAILANKEIRNQNDDFLKTIEGLKNISITSGSGSYVVSYQAGRKDAGITRMYEDGYITQNQAKQAFLEGITYVFRKNKVDMVAPHFVQWIIEELEKKYDKDTLFKGGIVVKTTLDLEQQKLAEAAMNANLAVMQDNGANNSAMVYVDSKNGDVLAYAGSINYFDEKIQGQNDMVRRPRQSGSSIKPLIYALGFEKLPLTIDTPIYDIPFKIGKDSPDNADNSFMGLIPLKYALPYSRNIAAVKMILALGGEEVAKPYLRSLGLSGVKENVEYGYTLALGAAEITMLQLANAYMNLSNTKPAVIDPILEIRSRDGSLIYQKQVQQQKEIIKPGISYLLWKILSEPANRMPGWVGKFNVAGLSLAIKSGTSNAKTEKGNRPRDGWLAAYNGSKVLIMRAGNADGTPMNRNAYGGTIHANPMKNFFTNLLKNNYISNDTIKQVDVGTTRISKLSGKTAGANTPAELTVDTMYYTKGVGLGADEGAKPIEYDISCKGQLSPATPSEEIGKGYVITPVTFMPNQMDLDDITQRWKSSIGLTGGKENGSVLSGNVTYNYTNVFVEEPQTACEGRSIKVDEAIKISVIKPDNSATQKFSLVYTVDGPRAIRTVLLQADGKQIAQFINKSQEKIITKSEQVISTLPEGEHAMQVIAVDKDGFSNTKDFSMVIKKTDPEAPIILEDKTKVVTRSDGRFDITLILDDESSFVKEGTITVGDKVVNKFNGNIVVFVLDTLSPILVKAEDAYGNKLEKSLVLQQQ